MSAWEAVFGKKFSRKRDAWLGITLFVIAPVTLGFVLYAAMYYTALVAKMFI